MRAITDFTQEHIEQAELLLRGAYERERTHAPVLPAYEEVAAHAKGGLDWLCNNGIGVAALDGDTLVGYLCATPPFENAFASTRARGVYVPLLGHGASATGKERERVYARLYQAAAKKWVGMGAVSHGITLFAQDQGAKQALFEYGFGLRCVDAIRPMEPIAGAAQSGVAFTLAGEGDTEWLCEMNNRLIAHLGQSPAFMHYPALTKEEFAARSGRAVRYWIASVNGERAAFVKLSPEGENFITAHKSMMNICGAYCLPEYRGAGVYPALINHVIGVLRAEGHALLGVDFESFNPTAKGFWLKHFAAYTHSVVRRIDENVVTMRG